MKEWFVARARRTALLLAVALLGLGACGGDEPADVTEETTVFRAPLHGDGAASPGAEGGHRVAHEGDVEVQVEDALTHLRVRHFLHTSVGRVELRFTGDAPELRTGSRIHVEGTQSGDVLALDPGGASVTALD